MCRVLQIYSMVPRESLLSSVGKQWPSKPILKCGDVTGRLNRGGAFVCDYRLEVAYGWNRKASN